MLLQWKFVLWFVKMSVRKMPSTNTERTMEDRPRRMWKKYMTVLKKFYDGKIEPGL